MKNYTLFVKKSRFIRLVWSIIWFIFARFFPRGIGNKWRVLLLRLFGAKVHKTARVYPSVSVYYPGNLIMEEYSCLGPKVNCYNVALIKIGKNSLVSQGTHLCSASHDISRLSKPLIAKPIIIGDHAWVTSDVFIGMGVTIGEGAVVGARSAVFKNVEPWSVVGGNPARFIKKRSIVDS
jgi:putative colanic acid biosynthesis acetyltransferase WcaF